MVAKENSYETCRVCCVLLKTSDIFKFCNVSVILLAPGAHPFLVDSY